MASFVRTAIVGLHSDNTATVAGQVFGYKSGISFGNNALTDGAATVRILSGASVTSKGIGVQIVASDSAISNLGTIVATRGIWMQGAADSVSTVTNGGVIAATAIGLTLAGSGTNMIVNTGTIEGRDFAILSRGNSADNLTNRGSLMGDVRLGGGDDLYDGRAGTVDGIVYGGSGADRFIPGSTIETFVGGAQFDVVDFRRSSGVSVALDGSLYGSGAAAGDRYHEIEGVFGSLTGADTIVGNSLANHLYGYGGADVLSGGGGKDRLEGGAGRDRLTGGRANDSFVFQSLTDCGDVITDFSNAARNDDRFLINASAFGGGLEAGALAAGQFITRSDNMAQDANNRFIFRTTDQTLWFDANGHAAGGLTLVADLQAGATVTAADILLI